MVFEQWLPCNPDVADVFLSATYMTCDSGAARREQRVVKTDRAEIGWLPGSREPISWSRPSARTRRALPHATRHGRKGGGIAAGTFGEQGGQAGLAQQIQAVVAGGTIGADADIDPLPRVLRACNAAAKA